MRPGKIILIRHGPPDAGPRQILDSIGFADWVQRYELATLCPDTFPAPPAIEAASAADVVFTSMLPRSRHSAEALGLFGGTAMSLFDEPGLPVPALGILRLPIGAWLILCRSLWLMGMHTDGETCSAARTRAAEAAEVLATAASTCDVAVIGHAWINRFIGSALEDRGWERGVGSSALWGVTSYAASERAVCRVNRHSV